MSVIIKGKNPRKSHTVRYWVDGRQRERSFATAREALDFKIKTDHDTRVQIFVDDKLGREDFGTAVDAWIDRHTVGDSTKDGYRVTARAWVKPTFAGRTIAQVGSDRDGSLTYWPRTWHTSASPGGGRPARSSRAPLTKQ
jgi:hypothetical protein